MILAQANNVLADELPWARDGMQNSAISSGHQNMPVVLYGISRDWSRSCYRGDEDDCMKTGLAFEEGWGDLKTEIRIALGYYLKACEEGAGEGCTKAATIIRSGNAGYVNAELAQQTAKRGCDEYNNQNACALVGAGLISEGGLYDNANALKIIENACSRGSNYACQVKATSLFYDKNDSKSKDFAFEMFVDACAREWAWGCSELAKAYITGNGKPKNTRKALEYGKKGCMDADGDNIAACSVYGEALITTGDPDDLDLGESFISDACTGGDARACNIAGKIGKAARSGSKIAQWEVPLFFRESCDMDYADGCYSLAQLYELGFDKVEGDTNAQIKLLQKACRLESTQACNKLTQMASTVAVFEKFPPKVDSSLTVDEQLAIITSMAEGNQKNQALRALVRLMYEGNADAQWLLAGWMYYGYPGLFDTSRQADAITLFGNAARQGHIEAAKFVGMAYWYGDGVQEDQNLGKNYMAIAAAQEDEEAVMIYRSMLNEPARQEAARRRQEMLAEQERRKNDWAYQFSLAVSNWSAGLNRNYNTGMNASQKAAAASWNRSQQALDKLHFNNRMNYLTGGTTACPRSNPYC